MAPLEEQESEAREFASEIFLALPHERCVRGVDLYGPAIFGFVQIESAPAFAPSVYYAVLVEAFAALSRRWLVQSRDAKSSKLTSEAAAPNLAPGVS